MLPPGASPVEGREALKKLRRLRSKDESGVAALEMALVLPALITLLAGIVDFGLVFNNFMAIRQGIGAGVRQGVVAQAGTSSSCPLSGVSGAPTATKELMCLTKGMIGLDSATTRTKVYFPGVKTKGGSLVLCAQSPLDSTTGLFEPVLDGILKAKVEMRIEQDLSAFGSASETSLPGGDWTWCQ